MKRIGIDLGNVIIGADTETEDPTAADEVPGAIEVIAVLNEPDDHEIWIVSKCYESRQKRSRKWLRAHRFFERTGVHRARLLFCYERAHKGVIAAGLGLTDFVDDQLEVLQHMPDGCRRIWFHHDALSPTTIQACDGALCWWAGDWGDVMGMFER